MNDNGDSKKWESPKKLKQPKEDREFLNVTPQAIAIHRRRRSSIKYKNNKL